MIILPAIDLKDGAVVRLYKGSFDTVHQVATDPVTVARAFQEAGATWIHMVDLDGARDGVRRNAQLVQAVAALGLQVELGGGIRSMEDLKAVVAGDVGDDVTDAYGKGISAVFSTNRVAQDFSKVRFRCMEDLSQTMDNIFRLIKIAEGKCL